MQSIRFLHCSSQWKRHRIRQQSTRTARNSVAFCAPDKPLAWPFVAAPLPLHVSMLCRCERTCEYARDYPSCRHGPLPIDCWMCLYAVALPRRVRALLCQAASGLPSWPAAFHNDWCKQLLLSFLCLVFASCVLRPCDLHSAAGVRFSIVSTRPYCTGTSTRRISENYLMTVGARIIKCLFTHISDK